MKRTRLLVSVRDAAEAEAGLAGGADWIDLKEPLAGPLGAVSLETALQAVARVAGRAPISAALGELVDWRESSSRGLLGVPGIQVVKLGLSGCAQEDDWPRMWLDAAAEVRAADKSLVAVVYADGPRARAPRPDEIIELSQQTACRYVLIDTFDKRSLGTLALLGTAGLRRILNCARRAGLRTVLAGGLTFSDLSGLPEGLADVVGVRGGVCRQGRASAIDPEQVRDFTQALAAMRVVAETCRHPEIA